MTGQHSPAPFPIPNQKQICKKNTMSSSAGESQPTDAEPQATQADQDTDAKAHPTDADLGLLPGEAQPADAKAEPTHADLPSLPLPGDEAQPTTDAKAQATTSDFPLPPDPTEPPLLGDQAQETAADLPPSPLSPNPEANLFLQENTMSPLPGDEAQATDADILSPKRPLPGDEGQATAADIPPLPLHPKPETNPFLQENTLNPLPGDEAQATDADLLSPPLPPKRPLLHLGNEGQETAADVPPSPLSRNPETNPFLQENPLSSSAGEAQATDPYVPLPLLPARPPLSPRMYVLVSKDEARITIPLRAALLSYKIRYDHRGTSEILCAIDAATLIKITPYLIKHSGCTEDGKSVKLNAGELKEWDHSVFLNEPIRILLNMLHGAMWLRIPGMAKLIETKLVPTDQSKLSLV